MPKSKLSKMIDDRGIKIPKTNASQGKTLWKGPEEDGVTQSLLGAFECCRERFRLKTVEGFASDEGFSVPIEYGNFWCVCKEFCNTAEGYEKKLREYATKLARQYPLQQRDISRWYQIVRIHFPIYQEYWRDLKTDLRPSVFELCFCVPYRLSDDRVVWLRGKIDGTHLKGKTGLYMEEDKTKSQIDESALLRQLGWDLQTQFYAYALTFLLDYWKNGPQYWYEGLEEFITPVERPDGWTDKTKLKGVLYDVVMRPLSGGPGTIKQLQKNKRNKRDETDDEYLERLREKLVEYREEYFTRFEFDLPPESVEQFQREYLHGALTQLTQWWDWVSSPEGLQEPFANPIHYRQPYGIYNPLQQGRETKYDEYLRTGSQTGLRRVETLFPELET